MTIDLRFSTPRQSFVAGEGIVLPLEIENRGLTSVFLPDPESNANWQPTYELVGPGPDDVARFDFRTVVRRRSPIPLTPRDASLIEIPAGATHTASVLLSRLVPIRRPGIYTLTARLDWEDIDVVSRPVSFSLEPLEARAIDVGISNLAGEPPEIYALWRHESNGRSVLFQAIYHEDRPDLGEMMRRAVVRIAEPAAGASQVIVPWGAHSRLDDLIGWALWREGQDLCGLPTMGRGPLRMMLPFVPTCWAFPALESRAHDIDMFFIGGPESRTLAMARIKHNGFARPPQGAIVWTRELPERVIGAAVAAQPNAPDKLRHLALVSADAERVSVRYAQLDGTTPPAKYSDVTLDDCTAAPGTPPAILAHDKGGARVSVLTASPKDPSRCRLVELLFGPPHPEGPTAISASIVLPVSPVLGQIRYHRHPISGVFRRDWALRGADGATYARGPGGTPHAARPPTDDPPPLALVVLANYSYLLERSPAGGFRFEHV
jgi:hypothetical protein